MQGVEELVVEAGEDAEEVQWQMVVRGGKHQWVRKQLKNCENKNGLQ